jgi:tetratricopeptide (TPR) repeat protein
MKFKLIYIYAVIALIVIAILVIVSLSKESRNKINVDITNQQLPHDDIHNILSKGKIQNPSSTNVSEEIKEKIEKMKNDVKTNPKDTLKLRKYADYLSVHNPDEAIKYYEKILSVDKKRKDIYFGMTSIYYNNHDLLNATETTKRLLAVFPGDPMATYNLGAIEATKGNKEKAKEIWNKLIKDFPDDETSKLAHSSLEKL